MRGSSSCDPVINTFLMLGLLAFSASTTSKPPQFGMRISMMARSTGKLTVCIHTVDAFENKMTPDVSKFEDVCTYPFLNPQTGPIEVEGAEPGDTLVVKIHEIEPTRDHAVTGLVPYFGGLTSTRPDPTLQDALEEQWLFLQAYHLLGPVGQMRLGNMVNPKFTMVAKFPKQYLG